MKIKDNSFFRVLLGALLCGFGEGVFLLHTKIIPGGFSGIANILYNTLSFPPGLATFLLNLIASIVCFKALGLKFLITTFITNGLFSFFIQVCSYIPLLTDDLLTSCILGGICTGFGTSLIMSNESTRGGSDIVARAIQKKFLNLQIGKFLLILDGSVVLAGLLVYKNTELVIYGLSVIAIETTIVDLIINKLNRGNMLLVITDKKEEMRKSLIDFDKRGFTVLEGEGGYTENKKGILLTAVKRKEVIELYDIIKEIDAGAFTINLSIDEINGEGFKIYR